MTTKKKTGNPAWFTPHRSGAGFTILEILLYIGISATVLGAIAALFALTLSARVKFQTAAEVNEEGVIAMQTITQRLRNAAAIVSPLPQGQSPTLTFTSTAGGSEHTTTVALSSGQITISEDAGSPQPLTSASVTAAGLIFRNLAISERPGSIGIEYSLNYQSPASWQEYIYNQHFYGSATLR